MKRFSIAVIAILFAGAPIAQAQSAPSAPATMAPSIQACVRLSHDMGRGAYDAAYGSEVTLLQQYLHTNGYLAATPVGVFGPLTRAAVVKFQAAHGVPQTGYVGPLTRAAIAGSVCAGQDSDMLLSSIAPSAGPIGTKVTLTGSGFALENNIVNFGGGALSHLPSPDGKTITFTVPEWTAPYCEPEHACTMMARLVTPGNYEVSVRNGSAATRSLTFTVTDETSGEAPVVTGLDAPAHLSIGQTGTWTVHAELPQTSDTESLHYAVTWGDEELVANGSAIKAPEPVTTQLSSTFTHAYAHTGTYTPVFTITDDAGRASSASASITIEPVY